MFRNDLEACLREQMVDIYNPAGEGVFNGQHRPIRVAHRYGAAIWRH